MKRVMLGGVLGFIVCALPSSAEGQETADPPQVSAPEASPPGTAGNPQAQPAQAAPPVAPPGYVLVPVQEGPQTRYDVQYPQRRGALPPGMELPYEEGQTIPPGYRLATSPRRGLVIAGSILTGIAWMISVTSAVGADFDDQSGWLVVPGIGPWLMLAAGGARDDCVSGGPTSSSTTSYSTTTYCSNSSLRAILVLDGMVQTAGAVMFVAGLAFPRKRLVRQDATVSVLPSRIGRDGYGVGVMGTF